MFEVMSLSEKGSDDLTMLQLPVLLQDLFKRSTVNKKAENNETVRQLLMRYHASFAKSDLD